MMKKLTALLLAACLMAGLTACSQSDSAEDTGSADAQETEAAGEADDAAAEDMAAEDAAFLLQYSLAEACKAFDLLELGHHAALIDHILRLGCGARTHALLKGEAHEPL